MEDYALLESAFASFEDSLKQMVAELAEHNEVLNPMWALAEDIVQNGISKSKVYELESLGISMTSNNLPIESFTDEPSNVQRILAGESIVSGVFGFVGGALKIIASIIAGVFKLIGRFLSWITGGSSTNVSYSSAASSITAANIPTDKATINGSAECLKYLPRAKQKSFHAAAVRVRTCVAMSIPLAYPDTENNNLVGLSKLLPKVSKELEKRLSIVDIAIRGLTTIEDTLDRMTTIKDYYSLEDVTIATNGELSKVGYAHKEETITDLIKIDSTQLTIANNRMQETLDKADMLNVDFADLAPALIDFEAYTKELGVMKKSSNIRGWRSAIDRATNFVGKVDHIEEKLGKLTGLDTLSPADLKVCKDVMADTQQLVKQLTNLITFNLNAFGRCVQYGTIPTAVINTITDCCKTMAENKLNNKTFEIAINSKGSYYPSK